MADEPSERVAQLLGVAHGHLAEVMFFRGKRELQDAFILVRVDLDDWKRERGLKTRSALVQIKDAVLGWSSAPSHLERALFSYCLSKH